MNRFLLLGWVLALQIGCQVFAANKPLYQPKSAWVESIVPDWDLTLPEVEIDGGILRLLYDDQVQLSNCENFFHTAYKVVNAQGLQNASEISLSWDPAYQTIILHQVRIRRNGEFENRLNPSEVNILQQELNAQMHVYNGHLTAYMILSDIRVGDMVEYSYTIRGCNPAFGSERTTQIFLAHASPVGRMYGRVIAVPNANYTLMGTEEKPRVEGGTWIWDQEWPTPVKMEEGTPGWVPTFPTAYISTYSNWETVAQQVTTLFKQTNQSGKEVKERIQKIMDGYQFEEQRVQAAIRFVQEDIRYMGVETGISGFRPYSPEKVINQRYGDCKDKSQLLAEILKGIGLEAYPVLVSTSNRIHVRDYPAMPYAFNHCIVMAKSPTQGEFWIDPTQTSQRGNPYQLPLPNYGVGLRLDEKGGYPWEVIPMDTTIDLIIKESYYLYTDKPSTLRSTVIAHNLHSDFFRGLIHSQTDTDIEDFFTDLYATQFSDIISHHDLIYTDDTVQNTITLSLDFDIPNIWHSESGVEMVSLSPLLLFAFADLSFDRNRSSAIELGYPLDISNEIEFHRPEGVSIAEEYIEDDNDFFFYNVASSTQQNIEGGSGLVEFRYYNKRDQVHPAGLEKFFQSFTNLENHSAYEVQKQTDAMTGGSGSGTTGVIVLVILLGLGGIGIAIYRAMMSSSK